MLMLILDNPYLQGSPGCATPFPLLSAASTFATYYMYFSRFFEIFLMWLELVLDLNVALFYRE